MKTPQTRPGTRRGFTLIELLIVIAIIGIILSLIGAAVVQAQRAGRRTQNRVEIGQLEVALDQFKQKFGAYPPSRLRLCESLAYYDRTTIVNASGQSVPNNQVDADSLQFLSLMFSHLDWSNGINWSGSPSFPNPPPPGPGMDGTPGNPCGAITLEGDQCLVFCLGGIPNTTSTPVSCLGFSSNPSNPSIPTQDRIGPFFEFPSNRLVVNTYRISINPVNRFLSYVDTYSTTDGAGILLSGAPYAYFSSYKTPNEYNRYAKTFNGVPVYPQPYPLQLSFQASDCSSLQCFPPNGLNPIPALVPYFETQNAVGLKYWKPNSFQIISAGQDGVFGVGGGPWNSVTGASSYQNVAGSGYDDQSNFTGSVIGAGPN
jgi:general secretion pathway protein G